MEIKVARKAFAACFLPAGRFATVGVPEGDGQGSLSVWTSAGVLVTHNGLSEDRAVACWEEQQTVFSGTEQGALRAFADLAADPRSVLASFNTYLAEQIAWQIGYPRLPVVRLFGDHTRAVHVPARRWADVNEFRAVAQRLRGFEAAVRHGEWPAGYEMI